MISRTFLLLLLVVFFNIFYADIFFRPVCFYTKFELTEGIPMVMEEFTLSLSIKAFQDLPNTDVEIFIPEGLEITDGQQQMVLNFNEGDSVAIPYKFRLSVREHFE